MKTNRNIKISETIVMFTVLINSQTRKGKDEVAQFLCLEIFKKFLSHWSPNW
jgi:hypothetical protein